ncbi:fimbrial protein [Acinetobacter lwoffii]|uniref:fimbrial protein n=1 Tax=Acinetobacter TaxID=469 RepID=UPI002731E24B|nr:fimbrial protein [Acinetobacter lwoffii]MDP1318246.1 fimbrial protein [Acinetobacter lwoffii]
MSTDPKFMIKIQHLLAFSLSAIFAAQVNAETGAAQIEFTGSIKMPTCIVKASNDAIKFDDIATSNFSKIGTVLGLKSFNLSLLQTGADQAKADVTCPSVAKTLNADGNWTPNVKITNSASELTKEGYLKNKNDANEQEATIAVVIQNADGKKLDLNLDEDKEIAISSESNILNFEAGLISLTDNVKAQEVQASLTFEMLYK